MFSKPPRVINVDTLLGIEETASRSSRKKPVNTKSVVVKEDPIIISTKTKIDIPVDNVRLDACFNELSTDGSNILWVGDRL